MWINFIALTELRSEQYWIYKEVNISFTITKLPDSALFSASTTTSPLIGVFMHKLSRAC